MSRAKEVLTEAGKVLKVKHGSRRLSRVAREWHKEFKQDISKLFAQVFKAELPDGGFLVSCHGELFSIVPESGTGEYYRRFVVLNGGTVIVEVRGIGRTARRSIYLPLRLEEFMSLLRRRMIELSVEKTSIKFTRKFLKKRYGVS